MKKRTGALLAAALVLALAAAVLPAGCRKRTGAGETGAAPNVTAPAAPSGQTTPRPPRPGYPTQRPTFPG